MVRKKNEKKTVQHFKCIHRNEFPFPFFLCRNFYIFLINETIKNIFARLNLSEACIIKYLVKNILCNYAHINEAWPENKILMSYNKNIKI